MMRESRILRETVFVRPILAIVVGAAAALVTCGPKPFSTSSASRWTSPSGYKLLHDHHGAILGRPALGYLSAIYVMVADTTSAWTALHEFREVDRRIDAFFTRSICGSLAARRAVLESVVEWIARDRAASLALRAWR